MLSREEVRIKIPAEFTHLYEFRGVILPFSAKANLPDLGLVRMRFVSANGEAPGCLYVRSDNGTFCADLYTIDPIEDLATMRTALREHINAFLDLSCLYNGWPYQAEIESCVSPSGEHFNLNVYSRAISEENVKYEKRVEKQILTTHKCFQFLTFALKDFRRAIQDPLETHTLVFRSIESIRNYYAEVHDLDTEDRGDRDESWRILRESLGYEKSDFDFLLKQATARRHGQVIFADAEELERCRVFGWQFLIKFIERTFGSDCHVPPK